MGDVQKWELGYQNFPERVFFFLNGQECICPCQTYCLHAIVPPDARAPPLAADIVPCQNAATDVGSASASTGAPTSPRKIPFFLPACHRRSCRSSTAASTTNRLPRLPKGIREEN
ncbi:unnamed protein product [Cuscuta epithymum]|uniref:Uncharacterized protein n=1 Tax=Cuscuta epithymum TaxID=186058 RepID=A0AAV0CME0_9ASTE|nr:unnamed protein product [Cuscuta epithymum]